MAVEQSQMERWIEILRHYMLALGLAVGLLLAGCTGPMEGTLTERTVPNGDEDLGQQLIAFYGCGSCHEINGVAGANSQVGPPLNDFHNRTYIAGSLPNTWENLATWVQDPQSIEPGTAMPNVGVTEEEARHIAAYLYNQPNALLPGGGWNPLNWWQSN